MRDVIIRCDCGGNHFVSLRYWIDDEPGGFLCIEGSFGPYGLWARAKEAASLLRWGRRHDAEVVLDYDHAIQLRDALSEAIPLLWKR